MNSTESLMPEDSDLLNFFRKNEVFRRLPIDVLFELIRLMQKRVLNQGQVLFRQGEAPDAIYLVLKGRLKVFVKEGEAEHFLEQVVAGDIVGETEVLTGEDRCETAIVEEESTVAALSDHDFEELMLAHAHVLESIGEGVLLRLRRKHLMKVLPGFLGAVPSQELLEIEEHTQWVHLPGREVLIAQGAQDMSVYLVLSGHLRAVRSDAQGRVRVVSEFGEGELIGETSFFMDRPSETSVYATRDSDLLRFTTSGLQYIVDHYPQIMLPVCRSLESHFDKILHKDMHSNIMHHIAVVPVSKDVKVKEFCKKLVTAMNTISPTLHLSSEIVDAQLKRPGAAQLSYGDANYIRYAAWRDEHQDDYPYVLYEADPEFNNWSRRCIRQCDHIILVGDAQANPVPGELERQLISYDDTVLHTRESLVLLHEPDAVKISGTARWFEGRKLDRHYHIKLEEPAHIERLARFLTGQAVGLALGGGGARGFAHLGAIAAVQELGVPIDFIGGVSIGSAVSAAYAVGLTRAEMESYMRKLVNDDFDYTAPVVALFSGHVCNETLKSYLSEMDILDLWIPFFCISTNLTTADVMIHKKGPVWHAVRASVSVPGVLPPAVEEDNLLVDGSLLNTIPVGIMKGFLDGGDVIAVDVSEAPEAMLCKPYGDEVSGWGVLLKRLNPVDQAPQVPGLGRLLYRVSEMGTLSPQLKIDNQQQAALYIEPDVKTVKLFDIERAQECIEKGYQATFKALQGWAKLETIQALFPQKKPPQAPEVHSVPLISSHEHPQVSKPHGKQPPRRADGSSRGRKNSLK